MTSTSSRQGTIVFVVALAALAALNIFTFNQLQSTRDALEEAISSQDVTTSQTSKGMKDLQTGLKELQSALKELQELQASVSTKEEALVKRELRVERVADQNMLDLQRFGRDLDELIRQVTKDKEDTKKFDNRVANIVEYVTRLKQGQDELGTAVHRLREAFLHTDASTQQLTARVAKMHNSLARLEQTAGQEGRTVRPTHAPSHGTASAPQALGDGEDLAAPLGSGKDVAPKLKAGEGLAAPLGSGKDLAPKLGSGEDLAAKLGGGADLAAKLHWPSPEPYETWLKSQVPRLTAPGASPSAASPATGLGSPAPTRSLDELQRLITSSSPSDSTELARLAATSHTTTGAAAGSHAALGQVEQLLQADNGAAGAGGAASEGQGHQGRVLPIPGADDGDDAAVDAGAKRLAVHQVAHAVDAGTDDVLATAGITTNDDGTAGRPAAGAGAGDGADAADAEDVDADADADGDDDADAKQQHLEAGLGTKASQGFNHQSLPRRSHTTKRLGRKAGAQDDAA